VAGNPNWTTDEIILTLDFYFQRGWLGSSDPLVLELSGLLNSLPTVGHREETFRNGNSVSMRLANYAGVDPGYDGVGLTQISDEARKLFEIYRHDQGECHLLAQAIREGVSRGTLPRPTDEDDVEDEGAVEGRFLTRMHRQRERNRTKVRQKLRQVRQNSGELRCEVCDLSESAALERFGNIHGELFECHHTKPLGTLVSVSTTRLADLAVVCPLCHRAIHRTEPMVEVSAMRSRVRRDHRPSV
jgi:5-methylcytosine-specific restriction protein A